MLYSYPVLMAADILLYNTTHVPVGEDQKQHLELTRDIALAFNRKFDVDFFNIPEPFITKVSNRVMSLRDGNSKMSKSDKSDNSRINLTDSDDLILSKIKKAKTDIYEGISFDKEKRPEASNLLSIYASITNETIEFLEQKFANKGFAEFKNELAEVLIEHIKPIRNEMNKLLSDENYLGDCLSKGSEKASVIANKNIKQIREIIGFVSF